jgi:hypothetical protein
VCHAPINVTSGTKEFVESCSVSGFLSTDPTEVGKIKTTIQLLIIQSHMLTNLSMDEYEAFKQSSIKNGYTWDVNEEGRKKRQTEETEEMEGMGEMEEMEEMEGMEETEEMDLAKTTIGEQFQGLFNCNNKNNSAIVECIQKGPEQMSTCIGDISQCTGSGNQLLSLLGYNSDSKLMARFIINDSNDTMGEFRNMFSTPFAYNNETHLKTYLHMDYLGVLLPQKKTTHLKTGLQNYESYYASIYGWDVDQKDRKKRQAEEINMAKTTIDAAGGMIDVMERVKTIVLGGLEDEIKQINSDIDGVNAEQRQNIIEVKTELILAKQNIERTRALLETLADETINRVDHMVHYLGLVKEDWEADKIAKFLKYQATKMAQLIHRSMILLNEADELYQKTTMQLGPMKVKLEVFSTYINHILEDDSTEYKNKAKTLRLEVYLPCCIPCPICCPICAAGVETKIGEWKDKLKGLETVIRRSQTATKSVLTDVDKTLNFLKNEAKLIIKWQGQLILVSEVDYTFPEAEIFGWKDTQPEVIATFNGLKTAAQNYLKNNPN